ncbi:HAMP domain-containing protein [Aliidiomarina halalkaliphila]|uniref:histidine kinase n=1 Tax=Aliidiomarina halalkaliphila TaxID=2593535 RepID=A0A552X1N4_9GAMM|nr:ATP-binding protein [Aliidiomarina halalkaliphila]TRW48952.1 HAMP domain-containing protein [Aliidiomarina halalkaliphila]
MSILRGFTYLQTRTQLFLAIAGSSLLLVGLILISTRYFFVQDFTRYMAEQERQRLQQVSVVLSDYYGRYERIGFTDELSERELWRAILSDIQRDVWLEPERFNLDSDLAFSELNFVTESGELIFGPRIEDAVSELVIYDSEILGILSTPMPRGAIAPIDAVFSQQQRETLMYAGTAAVILAALVAFLFAHGLRRRLQSLRHSTESLAAGDAKIRFSQSGADDVAQLGRTLNTLAATLQANETQRREFMADVAHELRTPLTVLQGELEAIEDGVRKADSAVIRRLQGQTKQLTRLVQDIDTLAQADLGGLGYQWRQVDIVRITQELCQQFQGPAQEQGLSLACVCDADTATAYADPDRLRQVLSNLLTNSLRYTDAPGEIRVHVLRSSHGVEVVVEDSAPGVDAEHLPFLFDRFYRVHRDRARHTGGSGLGLALVERIVHAHAGKVSASPSQLGGLRVAIQLFNQSELV